MRILFTTLAVLFSCNALALVKPALKIPASWRYQPGEDFVYLNAKQIREVLRQHGKAVPEFADYYTATLGDGWQPAADYEEKLEAVLTKAFEGIPDLKDGDVWNGYFPTDADTPEFPTCYLGDPTKLWDVFTETVGTFNTEQATALAWRYKNKKYIEFGDDEGEADAYFSEESHEWADWTGAGTDALYLFSTGDDGTDVNPALIHKCVN